MSYNYRYWRAKRKPINIDTINDLPEGNWVTVTKAAELKGYSRQTIYWRWLLGKTEAYCVSGGPLLVNLDNIK